MRLFRRTGIGPMVRNLCLFFMAITIVFWAVIGGQFPSPEQPYVVALSSQYYYDKGMTVVESLSKKMGSQALKNILKTELPAMSIADTPVQIKPKAGNNIIRIGLNLLSGVQLEDPLTYLKAEIPMMDIIPIPTAFPATPATADSFDEISLDEISVQSDPPAPAKFPVEVTNQIKSQKPLIALYNTHNSETYKLTDGLTHLKGKAGGVTIVAKEIQKYIQEKYQIPVVYSPTIHDLSFNRSYIESHKTAARLIKEYPELEMVFDVHRDGSMTREQSLAKVNGQSVAKILIVVGTDARAEHVNWRENLRFARKLSAKLDVMYPGLSRGIAINQGRYNQELSTAALLVEIGSDQNTTDEAVATGRLFATAVVALLNDMHSARSE